MRCVHPYPITARQPASWPPQAPASECPPPHDITPANDRAQKQPCWIQCRDEPDKETDTSQRTQRNPKTPKKPKPRSTNTNQQGFKGRSNRHLGNWRSMKGWLQTTRPHGPTKRDNTLKPQPKGAPNATQRGEQTGLGTEEGPGNAKPLAPTTHEATDSREETHDVCGTQERAGGCQAPSPADHPKETTETKPPTWT